MTKARIKRPSYKHMDIYIYIYTGADTGFSSGGGTNRARSAREIFCPPLSSSGGGQGGGTEFRRKGKILHHL